MVGHEGRREGERRQTGDREEHDTGHCPTDLRQEANLGQARPQQDRKTTHDDHPFGDRRHDVGEGRCLGRPGLGTEGNPHRSGHGPGKEHHGVARDADGEDPGIGRPPYQQGGPRELRPGDDGEEQPVPDRLVEVRAGDGEVDGARRQSAAYEHQP